MNRNRSVSAGIAWVGVLVASLGVGTARAQETRPANALDAGASISPSAPADVVAPSSDAGAPEKPVAASPPAVTESPPDDGGAVAPPALSDGGPTEHLEVVEVLGHKLEETVPKELARYGTRVDTIGAEQIRNTGQPDVAGSLQKLAPGLYVSPKNGPFDYVDVSFQGSRTEDILWLLDGVRLNNRLYGGTTPLDTFPASIVERLEILEGPQALLYGTQSVAGAINIVTRSFTDEPDGALSLGGDTTGGRHLDGYFRTRIGAHGFVVYGSVDQSAGFQPFRDQDYQPSGTDRHRAYEMLTVGAKYAFDVRPDLRVSAHYQHTDGQVDDAKPYLANTAFNQRDEDILTGKVEYFPNAEAQIFAKVYYHSWQSHFTEFDNVIGTPGTLTVGDDHEAWGYHDYGANVLAKVAAFRWLDAFAGYDFQRYDGSDAVLVITQKTEAVNALFAELRTPDWVKPLRLAVGARYNVPSVGESAAVWDATGQYTFGEALFVRGLIGTAFRLPTAEELFANDPQDERGDPDLKPERSFNANLSLGGHAGFAGLPGVSWEAIGFYRDVTDLISASGFDPTTMQSLFENIAGTVRVRGVTFVVDAQLPPSWSGSVSYTYSSAEQTAGEQIDRVPRQQAKAFVDWHPTDLPVGAMMVANYVGDVYQSFGDTDRERYGGQVILDVGARVFLDRERRHKINLTLSNVFDTAYAASLGKGVSDADGSSYTYWNLGAPRTLAVRYTYRF